ncbi:MAG: bifunctional demethylmenaquinone methyltransferase/2-methoxy-6-polyprenyl-1,4-benzoquinol methylase UbiE [Ponticaulis sp.]|nr:bifunctional demethylmenaquinone methyltransferase/2-methoxy-6-polyprenyl-1,4-benzoquinol methylase UbiE [Ponticaulis sp.]
MSDTSSHESSTSDDQPKVSFGFEDVSATEKVSRVKGVFRSVASRYDLMNDLMSAGVHRIWKANTIARLNPQPGERILDVAGGTGDVALAFLKSAEEKARRRGQHHLVTRAIVCDINEAMLAAGRSRESLAKYRSVMDWVTGDGMQLPFRDNSVDALSIAFGIRNVADMDMAFREFRRVLKPGGRFACLEFSHMTAGVLQDAYDAYSFNVIPKLGDWITGDAASYQYLVESIRRFPKQDEVTRRITEAGFSQVSCTNYSGGIAALHFGWAV